MGKVWRVFKPDLPRIGLTLIMPFIIGGILTLSLEGSLAFYEWMLTPGYTVYADIAYYEFNYFVLLWVPIYLVSCIFSYLISMTRGSH